MAEAGISTVWRRSLLVLLYKSSKSRLSFHFRFDGAVLQIRVVMERPTRLWSARSPHGTNCSEDHLPPIPPPFSGHLPAEPRRHQSPTARTVGSTRRLLLRRITTAITLRPIRSTRRRCSTTRFSTESSASVAARHNRPTMSGTPRRPGRPAPPTHPVPGLRSTTLRLSPRRQPWRRRRRWGRQAATSGLDRGRVRRRRRRAQTSTTRSAPPYKPPLRPRGRPSTS